MTLGDPVEVNKVWAGGTLVPLKRWFGGYAFVSFSLKTSTIIVEHTEGMFRGVHVSFPACDVRRAGQ